MKLKGKSPTYTRLFELYFILRAESKQTSSVYINNFTDTKFERSKVDNSESNKLSQPIFIADTSIYDGCTIMECYILCKIQSQLKKYNCLWHCDDKVKNNSANRKAINSLIKKGIIEKTETTNVYIVNPKYIRRGDPFAVLVTTMNMLSKTSKVNADHISDKTPINEFKLLPEESQSSDYIDYR